MMRSPEEYFNAQDYNHLASSSEYTPAELLFMQKYLGLDDQEIFNRLGLEAPKASAPAAAEVIAPTAADLNDAVQAASEDVQPTGLEENASEEFVAVYKPGEQEVALDTGVAGELAAPVDFELAQGAAEPEKSEDLQEAVVASPEALTEKAPTAEAVAPETTTSEGIASEITAEAGQEIDAAAAVEPASATEELPVQADLEPKKPIEAPQEVRSQTIREAYEEVLAKEPPLETILRQEAQCQMVGFYIGDQEFVVPTKAMQEVIRYETPIRIPLAPPFVTGVISLRGRVTPVVNLRNMLVVNNAPLEGEGCIIICQCRGLQLGFLVEKIHTMYRVDQKDLDWGVEAQLGSNAEADFISGIMKSDGGNRLIGIISVDRIVEYVLH